MKTITELMMRRREDEGKGRLSKEQDLDDERVRIRDGNGDSSVTAAGKPSLEAKLLREHFLQVDCDRQLLIIRKAHMTATPNTAVPQKRKKFCCKD